MLSKLKHEPAHEISVSTQVYPFLDESELAEKWRVTRSQIVRWSRASNDPIPSVKLGRARRFRWGSPELDQWITRRMNATKK